MSDIDDCRKSVERLTRDRGEVMRAGNDKIAEIRKRHLRDDRWRNGPSMICPQAHDDRSFLLAEVDRLSSDLRVQQGCCDGAAAQDAHVRREREEHKAEIEKLRAEIERLRAANKQLVDGIDTITRRKQEEIKRLREALEGVRVYGPDADGMVWAVVQHPKIPTRSHVLVGNMDRMVSQALLEFEQIRRNALEGKP